MENMLRVGVLVDLLPQAMKKIIGIIVDLINMFCMGLLDFIPLKCWKTFTPA